VLEVECGIRTNREGIAGARNASADIALMRAEAASVLDDNIVGNDSGECYQI